MGTSHFVMMGMNSQKSVATHSLFAFLLCRADAVVMSVAFRTSRFERILYAAKLAAANYS